MVFAVSVLALSHRMAPATARRWGWAAVGALFAFTLISVFSIGRYVMLLTLAAVAAMAAREAGRAAGSGCWACWRSCGWPSLWTW